MYFVDAEEYVELVLVAQSPLHVPHIADHLVNCLRLLVDIIALAHNIAGMGRGVEVVGHN
jgi:hypothetical protein